MSHYNKEVEMKKILSVFVIIMLLIGTIQTAAAAGTVPLDPMDGLRYLIEETSAFANMQDEANDKNVPNSDEESENPIRARLKAAARLMPTADGPFLTPVMNPPANGTITITGLHAGTEVKAYRLVELESADGVNFSNKLNAKYSAVFTALGVTNPSTFAALEGGRVLAAAQQHITAAADVPTSEFSATVAAEGTSVHIENVDYGFYYIAMQAQANDFTIYNPMLVLVPQVNEDGTRTYDVEAAAKSSSTGIVKKIEKDGALVDSAAASIGDTISYRLTTPVPEYKADIDDRMVVFKITDTMSAGLTYTDGVTVYGVNGAGETLIADAANVTDTKDPTTGKTTVVMDFDYAKIKGYQSLKITYTALLNEAAVIGAPGNPNEADLTYSHDTSKIVDGKYETKTLPKDETVVYTYGLDITKYELGDPSMTLAGAAFSLKTAAGEPVYFKVKNAEDNIYTAIFADVKPDEAAKTVRTSTGGKLIIEGLGAGTYTLTEEAAPTDYHIIDKTITVNITPELNSAGAPTGTLTQDAGVTAGAKGAGYLVKNIANSPDYTLPFTGGVGTMIFLLAATITAAIAVVLIYRRQQNKQ